MEIRATCMLGVIGNITPFMDHSASPRGMLLLVHVQADDRYPGLQHALRIDTTLHTLQYVQKAIVTTQVSRFVDNSGHGI